MQNGHFFGLGISGLEVRKLEPKVNRWTCTEIQAVLKGAERLDGEWKSVEGATAAEKAAMRFFKVVVEVQ